MQKVAVYTLGCKVNQYESEGVMELFRQKGYEIVNFGDFADIYVINTCTVTNLADRKSRQMISKARKINENAIIAVIGCYSQVAPDIVSKIPGVDIVIGTKNRSDIVNLVEKFKSTGEQINAVEDVIKTKEYEDFPITTNRGRTRAFLKIQEGCNQFCSYCIIPYARGPIRSRSLDNIINEVKKLRDENFKEIVLTGIHVESYGRDLNKNIDLIDVINSIDKIEGIERIRLSSVDPTLINRHFFEKLQSEKLCPHFHLSLQSGCDETLKRMNRKYNTSEYRQAVDLLREHYKDVSITTDIMVGFPGETDDEFNQSFEFAKQIKFSKIHVFKYSPRKGTKAAELSNQIDPKIKDQRSKLFIELSEKCQREFYEKFIGTVQNVLFEQKFKENKNLLEGYTPNYIKVVAEADKSLIGQIKKVKLEELKGEYIQGIIE